MLSSTLFDDTRGCMGDQRRWALLAAAALVVTACSDSTPDPTLATGTTAPVTAAPTTTAAVTAPPTTGASTTQPPTTTESPDARLAQIERMVQEAYVGRLLAIYNEDKQALLTVIGSQSLYDNAVEVIDDQVIDFSEEPDNSNTRVNVTEVLLDRTDCVVTAAAPQLSSIVGIDSIDPGIYVWWPTESESVVAGAVWDATTPESQWIEECDIAVRGVTP